MATARERELFGPTYASVLHQQNSHRSRLSSVNIPHEEQLLTLYHSISSICWATRYRHAEDGEVVELHPRVWDRLEIIGLYGAARCGAMILDAHLITALVERWRPETHTFHLPIGEATVTLEDVAIMWGLPIDGQPLIMREEAMNQDQWRAYCDRWLGFTPNPREMRGKACLKLVHLSSRLREQIKITDLSTEAEVDQCTRICALILIGSLLMPNTTRNSVPLFYLRFLENFQVAGQYSWGSAVLAVLYREMCNAAKADSSSIAGPLTLVQIWAWSRILPIRPQNLQPMILTQPYTGPQNRNLGVPPYASRWICHHNFTTSTANSIRVYRDILDRLSDGQFAWQPYDHTLPEIRALPQQCLTASCMAVCPLIQMGVVEHHRPDRVLRQFGCIQDIPSPVSMGHYALHNVGRYRVVKNWPNEHHGYILDWGAKEPYGPVLQIQGGRSSVDGYMGWYIKITRRIVSPHHYDVADDIPGYQPPQTSMMKKVFKLIERLRQTHIKTERSPSQANYNKVMFDAAALFKGVDECVDFMPPYLVSPPSSEDSNSSPDHMTRVHQSSAQVEDIEPSTLRAPRRHSPLHAGPFLG